MEISTQTSPFYSYGNNEEIIKLLKDSGFTAYDFSMYDFEKDEPVTSHTTNDTPFILIGAGDVQVNDGSLCDIAPTMLELMGIEQPSEMTGKSLIR